MQCFWQELIQSTIITNRKINQFKYNIIIEYFTIQV